MVIVFILSVSEGQTAMRCVPNNELVDDSYVSACRWAGFMGCTLNDVIWLPHCLHLCFTIIITIDALSNISPVAMCVQVVMVVVAAVFTVFFIAVFSRQCHV